MQYVRSLDQPGQRKVISLTEEYIRQAALEMNINLKPIPVVFDLRGRSAGMYQAKNGNSSIRYNPWLFARFYPENLATTVPHEVAHYVVDMKYGLAHTKPHGKEWRSVMKMFGVDARATCNFDLKGIPVRTYRQFQYRCGCRSHQLTSIRHKRVLLGANYYCRSCQQLLVSQGS